MGATHGKTLQVFLERVSKLADNLCGRQFAEGMASLRAERERLLKNSWREQPPVDLDTEDIKEFFREIDFDTIVANAAEHLRDKEYPKFLYRVAEIAIEFGEMEKAQRLLQLVSMKLSRTADRELLAKSHQRLGDVAFYRNNWKTTQAAYNKSLKLYDSLGDREGVSNTKNALGAAMVEQGKTSKGEALLKEAKKVARSVDHSELLVKININLGNVYNIRGSWDEAVSCYEEALQYLGTSETPSEILKARVFHDMAIVHKSKGEYSKALTQLHKSIKLSTKSNNLYFKGLSYLEEAEITCRKGDFGTSTALATSAFKIFSELGDRLSVAEVYKVFGMINRARKKYDQAFSYFENSIRINEDYNNQHNLGETLIELAELFNERGDKKQAQAKLRSAIKCFRKIQAITKVKETQQAIASLAN